MVGQSTWYNLSRFKKTGLIAVSAAVLTFLGYLDNRDNPEKQATYKPPTVITESYNGTIKSKLMKPRVRKAIVSEKDRLEDILDNFVLNMSNLNVVAENALYNNGSENEARLLYGKIAGMNFETIAKNYSADNDINISWINPGNGNLVIYKLDFDNPSAFGINRSFTISSTLHYKDQNGNPQSVNRKTFQCKYDFNNKLIIGSKEYDVNEVGQVLAITEYLSNNQQQQ